MSNSEGTRAKSSFLKEGAMEERKTQGLRLFIQQTIPSPRLDLGVDILIRREGKKSLRDFYVTSSSDLILSA